MSHILQQHHDFLKAGGVFEFAKTVLKFSGPDAADFLHRLTTQNIKAMAPGTGVSAAVLQPNAMMVSLFELYHCGNFFLIVANPALGETAAAFFEKFHFAENLEIKNISDDFGFLSVQGARAPEVVQGTLSRVPTEPHDVVGTEDSFIFRESDFQGPGFHLLIKKERMPRMVAALSAAGFVTGDAELWNLMRFEAGHFVFGTDIGEKNLVLEGALSDFVSRDKGCYPGQEVVERVFTYGNVAKKLVGLRWSAPARRATDLKPGQKVYAGDKEAGVITSATRIPWSEEVLGRAVVRKPYYQAGEKVNAEGVDEPAVIYSLPNSFEIHREPKATALDD